VHKYKAALLLEYVAWTRLCATEEEKRQIFTSRDISILNWSKNFLEFQALV